MFGGLETMFLRQQYLNSLVKAQGNGKETLIGRNE